MSGRGNEWKLGLFIVSAMAVGVGGLVWLGASRLQRDSFEAIAFFDETVDGLDPGSPVKYLGVTIGQVKKIGLAPDARHVRVTAEIYVDALERNDLPTEFPNESTLEDSGLRIQLVSSALTGVAFLEGRFFDPGQNPIPEYPFETPPNTLYTVPSTLKALETGLIEAMESIPKVVEESVHILERVEKAIEELQLRKVSEQVLQLMASLKERLDTLEELPLLAEGATTMVEARVAIADIRQVLDGLGGEDGSVARVLDRYEALGADLQLALQESDFPGVARSLRGVGEDAQGTANEVALLSAELRVELKAMREAFESVQSLAISVERDPGSLLYGKTPQQRPNRN